jgi:addiction module RelE/StbE family toxin
MSKSVEYSTRARNNLKKIKEFIEQDNPAAAARVVEYLTSSADSLAEFPLLGHVGEIAGVRELVLTKFPYTIVYRLTPGRVRVITVLHQSQDHA